MASTLASMEANYSTTSKLVEVGRWTYGADSIEVKSWGCPGKVIIGSYCSISSNVTVLLGGNHDMSLVSTYPFPPQSFSASNSNPHSLGKRFVVIGSDVWIGYSATILDGVTIGHGAVIGANSVVAKDIPPYSIAVGNPARIVKMRFNRHIIDILLKTCWWDLPDHAVNVLLPLLQRVGDLSTVKQLYMSSLQYR